MGLPDDFGPHEFDCIDCATHVYRIGPRAANDQSLCATCEWLRGIEDPADREKLRKFLNHET